VRTVRAGRRRLVGRTEPFDAEVVRRARRLMRRGSALNVRIFRATGGRLGSRWRVGRKFLRGVPVCLVTTRGRRSGLDRTVPLLYLADGDDVVIVASQGGMPRHPDWYHNLVAETAVRIEVRGRTVDATARVADPSERHRLWPLLVELYPSFAVYQARAEREIPVVVCSPRPA
jgi:F420H(2)-dependent quinone reductase